MGVLFLLLAVAQAAIAARGAADVRNHPNRPAVLILLVVVSLAYENAVLALGTVLEPGLLLEGLNAPRYWVHGLLTPVIMWAALELLAMAGVAAGASRIWRGAIGTLTLGAMALGLWTDVIGLDLEPVTESGLTRYVNAFEPLPGPPVGAVLTIIVVLVLGVILWRANRWPWLAASALAMLATAPIQGALVVQNLGEVVFAAGLVATAVHASRRYERASSPSPTRLP